MTFIVKWIKFWFRARVIEKYSKVHVKLETVLWPSSRRPAACKARRELSGKKPYDHIPGACHRKRSPTPNWTKWPFRPLDTKVIGNSYTGIFRYNRSNKHRRGPLKYIVFIAHVGVRWRKVLKFYLFFCRRCRRK